MMMFSKFTAEFWTQKSKDLKFDLNSKLVDVATNKLTINKNRNYASDGKKSNHEMETKFRTMICAV